MNTPADLKQAIERYEKFALVDSTNAPLQLSLGDLYHQAGRFDDAIAAYGRCLDISPGHPAARSRTASVMISLHRFADAEKILSELIAGGETDAALFHNRGLAQYYLAQYDDAITSFVEADGRELKSPSNLTYWARSLHHLGKLPEALEICRRWVEIDPGAESKSYLALLTMDNGNPQEAGELALEVLKQNPENVDANIVAGSARTERQEMDEARSNFETALAGQKENGRAWLGLGLVHLYNQEIPEAIDALKNAVRIYPDNPGIIGTLGWAQLIARDFVASEKTFEQALKVDRTFSESHGGYAAVLAVQGKADLAQHEIKIAKRLDPNSFGADFAQSVIMANQGQQQAGAEHFAKALDRTPREDLLPLIDQLRIYATKKGAPKQ
jgi:tetratricopeptide (TPR) repeat protein